MALTVKKLNFFLIFNLPSAYLCGVRVLFMDHYRCEVGVRHRWINKNPFRSMFWAVQGMAAELTTGALVMNKIKALDRKVSMLVIENEAYFSKKAKGYITFRCEQGRDVDLVLKKVLDNDEGQTLMLHAEGHDESGDLVSRFSFKWSLKLKKN